MATTRRRTLSLWIGWGLLILLALPFVHWSLTSGVGPLTGADLADNRFYTPQLTLANLAIFSHMALGAGLMLFIPLQVWPGLRQRWPGYHRWMGRVLCLAGVIVGLGGLTYIAMRGTIGGVWMNAGFALYGALVVICAGQALRHARYKAFAIHRQWALRLLVLSFGSWLYRVHYGLWYLATGGVASTPDFDGAFDLVQNFAFYLPYLLALELELWMRRAQSV
ncbi:DUF2306 domain-containing protein [Roseobacter cerasinus]|uniref:DUF2306 domain-containing protein n=1 Tax=Roseobacter cerasinus TaxID=2602289 RepID=A0A640VV01_9RHOB|nr:DUF2306 domain-containing protein [Roseobacter cerasinus]